MRKMWLAGAAAVASVSAPMAVGQAVGPATQTAPAARMESPAQLAQRYVAEGKAPGIVVAYAKGDVAPTVVAAGGLSLEPGAAVTDIDSLWRVYSMTKPITGIAAMMLVEDGKLGLDQPIGDFFSGFKTSKVLTDPANSLASRPAARPITVRHLLTHTAGLGYTIVTKGPLLAEYNRLGLIPAALAPAMEPELRKVRPASLKEFADRVATAPLIADPGTVWSYSISMDVLAAVVEAAAGMPFEQFLQTRMFGPLGMTSTYWTVPAGETKRFATNFFWTGDKLTPFDRPDASAFTAPPSFPYGGAGLVMSARDYDRFLHMLVNEGTLDGKRVMKAETVRLAMSDLLPAGVTFTMAPGGSGGDLARVPMGYGAGGSVYLASVPGGPGKGTYGWGGAAGTAAWVDPENKVRATVMVNYMPSDKWPLRADAVRAIYGPARR
ncbi:serine hydrolase domain-containing protein [Sphingomonas turrisvirgatae]|uniref:Serine hydrolase n=1 Tax=Sphingomonas turrisvirgatae TaxID=1888892 RepID=A0A1E3M0P1_9SPHN|nr:serine hydrolase domain-containing protein [Sphingomonas turrisvirgatae]ODP39548.1 serine hydrolase [Sphingomonas turrisvirgatae]